MKLETRLLVLIVRLILKTHGPPLELRQEAELLIRRAEEE